MKQLLLVISLLALAFSAGAAPLTEISIVKKYADRGDPEAQFVLGSSMRAVSASSRAMTNLSSGS